jgi:hypothetical protein
VLKLSAIQKSTFPHPLNNIIVLISIIISPRKSVTELNLLTYNNWSLFRISMDYARLCQAVFSLHEDVRYAGVVDDAGSVIAGGMKSGMDSLIDENNEELYLTQTALRKSMRERFDRTLGKARFAYVEREKISILTFYMDENLLLVTLEPNISSHTAIDIAEDVMDVLAKKDA